jgi:hypothetical protein
VTTISPDQVREIPPPLAKGSLTFTVTTTDREVSAEDERIVAAVVAGCLDRWLSESASLRVVEILVSVGGAEISVDDDDEAALMAEGYRELSDEMLRIAHEARPVQLRAITPE